MSRTILLTGLLAVATSGLQLGHSGTTVATHQNIFIRRSPADSAAMRGGSSGAANSRASSSQGQSQEDLSMSSEDQPQEVPSSESREQSRGGDESEAGRASGKITASSAAASKNESSDYGYGPGSDVAVDNDRPPRPQESQDPSSSGGYYRPSSSHGSEGPQASDSYGNPGPDNSGASSSPDPTPSSGDKAPGRKENVYGSPTGINTDEFSFNTGLPSGVASSTGSTQSTEPVYISEASPHTVSRAGVLLGFGAVIMALCLS